MMQERRRARSEQDRKSVSAGAARVEAIRLAVWCRGESVGTLAQDLGVSRQSLHSCLSERTVAHRLRRLIEDRLPEVVAEHPWVRTQIWGHHGRRLADLLLEWKRGDDDRKTAAERRKVPRVCCRECRETWPLAGEFFPNWRRARKQIALGLPLAQDPLCWDCRIRQVGRSNAARAQAARRVEKRKRR